MDERVGNILQALHFIEQHLREPVCVGDMARSCGYSLYHFIRLFNQLVHHTPYDYLIRRRLAQVAGELLTGNKRIIDLAMDYCFQNAETFTRAFNRVYHTQPNQVRKTGFLDTRLILRARTAAHLSHFQDHALLHPANVIMQESFIAGLPCRQELSAGIIEEFVNSLKSYRERQGQWYWVKRYPAREEACEPTHFFGFEIIDRSAVPAGVYVIQLPVGSCAVFQHNALIEKLNLTRDYIYQTWLANSNQQICSPLEICMLSLQEISMKIKVCIPYKNAAA